MASLLAGAFNRQPGFNEHHGDGPAVITSRTPETERIFDILGPRTLEIAEDVRRQNYVYDLRSARDYDQIMTRIGVYVERHEASWPDFVDALAPLIEAEHFGAIAEYWEFLPHALGRTEELVAPSIMTHKIGETLMTTSDFSKGVEFTNQSLFTEKGRFAAVEMIKQLPQADQRTRKLMVLWHLMGEQIYRKNVFDLEGVKTYDRYF